MAVHDKLNSPIITAHLPVTPNPCQSCEKLKASLAIADAAVLAALNTVLKLQEELQQIEGN